MLMFRKDDRCVLWVAQRFRWLKPLDGRKGYAQYHHSLAVQGSQTVIRCQVFDAGESERAIGVSCVKFGYRIENGKADIRLSTLAKVLGSIGFDIVAMPQK